MPRLITNLHAINLGSTKHPVDVERLQALFGIESDAPESNALGIPRQWGLHNITVNLHDAPHTSGIESMTFGVNDMEHTHKRLRQVGLADRNAVQGPGPVLQLATHSTRGLGISFTGASTALSSRDVEPELSARGAENSITGLDHIVIATDSVDGAAALFGARLGLDMRLDLDRPDWGVRLLFFRAGDVIVEVAHQTNAQVTDIGKPSGSEKDAFYGLSWRTRNVDACRERLKGCGFSVSEIRAGRKSGTRVFTVHDGPCGIPTLIIQPR